MLNGSSNTKLFSFDEDINAPKSKIHISHEDNEESRNFPDDSENNIYSITELFPGTGLITIDIESWDNVGNGIITNKSIVYENVVANNSTIVDYPNNLLSMNFQSGDIQNNSSLFPEQSYLQYSPLRLKEVSLNPCDCWLLLAVIEYEKRKFVLKYELYLLSKQS